MDIPVREFYRVAAGSQRLDMRLAASDFDYWSIADVPCWKTHFDGDKHYIYYPIEEGIQEISGFPKRIHWLVVMFPLEAETAVSKYLKQNAEQIIAANKKYLFNLLLDYIDDFGVFDMRLAYKFNPKQIAYKMIWMNIFILYEKLGCMEKSIEQAKVDKVYYLKIRNGVINFEDVKQDYEKRKKELLSTLGFYNVDADTKYLDKVQEDLREIIRGIRDGEKNLQP